MKTRYFLLCVMLFFMSSSFSIDEACEYMGSNMEYVKTQTRKAISTTDLEESHFLAYRAIKALQNSRKKMEDCECVVGTDFAKESLDRLIEATKSSSLDDNRLLLNKSLEHTIESITAIENHAEHGGPYGTEVLAMNTIGDEPTTKPVKEVEGKNLRERIDISLLSYEASLQTVVETVECKEAHAFATRIYNLCEEKLLDDDLSEAKKYYNLRTKQITAEALKKLGDCPESNQ